MEPTNYELVNERSTALGQTGQYARSNGPNSHSVVDEEKT